MWGGHREYVLLGRYYKNEWQQYIPCTQGTQFEIVIKAGKYSGELCNY